MAKKLSLLDEVRQLPKHSGANRAVWYDEVRNGCPGLYAELVEVVNDFNNRGDAFEVFRTVAALHKFLLKKDESRTGSKALSGIGSCMFRRFVIFVKEHPNG